MARIRTIKPEFFTSEDIVSLTPLARLFYVSLWCQADREGRLEWKRNTLKMRCLPSDDCDVEDLGRELVEGGLIILYQHGGKTFAQILEFKKHQVINNREQNSEIPPPPAKSTSRVDDASMTRESGREGKEGKGKEGREGKEEMAKTGAAGCSAHPQPDLDHGQSDEGQGLGDEVPDPAEVPLRLVSDECPHQAILTLWAELLPAARQPRDWPSARQALLRTRWREDRKRQNLDWWRKFFGYVARSAFLTGKKSGHKNQRPFDLGLDWLLESRNFLATIEGKYHEPHENEQQGGEDAA